jgi:ribonuclease D
MRKGERERIDYRETLSPAEFEVYAKLRDVRKEISEREGVPLFAVAVNDQLAEMAKRRVSSKAGLREVVDFGEARIRKYGREFLRVLGTPEELSLLESELVQAEEVTGGSGTVVQGVEHATEDKGRSQRNRELFESE